MNMLKKLLIIIVKLYKYLLSPMLPSSCKYYPSCSEYAVLAIERRSIPRALLLIVWRILRCNPFSKGGYDTVEKL